MAVLYRDPAAPDAAPDFLSYRTNARHDALLAGDADAWRLSSSIEWGPSRYPTRFGALWTTSGLYVRFEAADDTPWSTLTRRDDRLWEEEVVEIFLDPAGSGREYAEIEVSPANVVCDLVVREAWPSLSADRDWDWQGLESRVRTGCGLRPGWTAIVSLPWAGLVSLSTEAARRVPPAAGDRWRFNVFRIKRPHGPGDPERDAVYAAWSVPEGPSFHVPARFRDLVFAEVGTSR
jgi:hypothetical protein